MDAATALMPRMGVPAGFVPPALPLAPKLPEGADALAHAARGWLRRRGHHAWRLRRESLTVAAACSPLHLSSLGSNQPSTTAPRALLLASW